MKKTSSRVTEHTETETRTFRIVTLRNGQEGRERDGRLRVKYKELNPNNNF